jgi:ribosome-binding factor A
LRKKLGEVLDLRRVPELRFFFDESIERGEKMEKLLGDLD